MNFVFGRFLQSKEQLVTHGHINFWYFEKLKKALEFAGFKTIEM